MLPAIAPDWHIAQANIAIPHEPIDSPALADFVALLDPVNALADRAPGFVWRLQTEEGDATSIRPFDDERIIVNMSVWESIEALWGFVYDGSHLEVMRRRREWFTKLAEAHLALWWVPAGSIPTVEEMSDRVEQLRAHGPTPYAFTFKLRFPPPSAFSRDEIVDERDPCPA
jgi:hypothetical protein